MPVLLLNMGTGRYRSPPQGILFAGEISKSGALWATNEKQLNPKVVRQRMFPKKGQYKLRPKRQE